MRRTILMFMIVMSGMAVNAQQWLTDINEAKKEAEEKDRDIVLVFQGTDWCAPCIKLQKEIWDSDEFREYAKDHFVLLKAEFLRRKKNQLSKEQQKKNKKLAEQYNKQGYFPLVVVLDKTGKVLGTIGYRHVSPGEYIRILTSFE